MRVAEYFAGGGGAALGLKWAGMSSEVRIERDRAAVETLDLNLGGVNLCRDVFDLEDVQIHADVGWFSPPCQPHSQQGKGLRESDDREATEAVLIEVSRRSFRWVVVENVRGYQGSEPGQRLIDFLFREGYTVSLGAFYASAVGTPQDRWREFIVAGPVEVQFPADTGVRSRPSMGAAIGWHLHDAEARKGNRKRPNTEPSRTISASGNTMLFDERTGKRRRANVKEAAALQGFPAGYEFCGTLTEQYRQIGNAVPPQMAREIGYMIQGGELGWRSECAGNDAG